MAVTDTKFSLPVRLTHFVSTTLLLLLIVTGVRLGWFHLFPLPLWLSELIDKVIPGGQIHFGHFIFGFAFVIIGVFYFTYLITSVEYRRLFNLSPNRTYAPCRKIYYLITLLVAVVSSVTGIIMYYGWYSSPGGHVLINTLHQFCFMYFILFVVIHTIESIFSKSTRFNSIFFSTLKGCGFKRKAVILSFFITVVIAAVLIFSIEYPPTLMCRQQNSLVVIDGRENLIEWVGAEEITIPVAKGVNFNKGVSKVTIKTFRDIQFIYFLVKWTDSTRSYNRFLEKTKGGWVEKVSEMSKQFGENIYYEDQLAISFHNNKGGCVSNCHIGYSEQNGLHYTDGDTADVWVWKAVSTNPVWQMDDRWWATFDNIENGGQHFDNSAAGGYYSNLNPDWNQPYFLSLFYGLRFWINLKSSAITPYFSDIDTFQIGAQVPAVLVSPFMGDRGDVRARGVWKDGVWTIELARPLKTGSMFDIAFKGELYLNVAPFDNAENKHAYHLQPIRLVIE